MFRFDGLCNTQHDTNSKVSTEMKLTQMNMTIVAQFGDIKTCVHQLRLGIISLLFLEDIVGGTYASCSKRKLSNQP